MIPNIHYQSYFLPYCKLLRFWYVQHLFTGIPYCEMAFLCRKIEGLADSGLGMYRCIIYADGFSSSFVSEL